jgi:hypothetical protein
MSACAFIYFSFLKEICKWDSLSLYSVLRLFLSYPVVQIRVPTARRSRQVKEKSWNKWEQDKERRKDYGGSLSDGTRESEVYNFEKQNGGGTAQTHSK